MEGLSKRLDLLDCQAKHLKIGQEHYYTPAHHFSQEGDRMCTFYSCFKKITVACILAIHSTSQ